MKKPYNNTIFSNLKCGGCGKRRIKANLVHKKCILGETNPHDLICYSCYDATILQPRRENRYDNKA